MITRAEERAKRKKAVDFACESVRRNGGVIDGRAEALFARYADGELSHPELDAEISKLAADHTASPTVPAVGASIQEVIATRLEAIRQAHASNLIEGLDMGAEALAGMLQRASEPISNEEFARREESLWLARHKVKTTLAA